MSTSDPEFAARLEQMGRFFMGTSNVHQALVRVAQKLEELAIPYAICGGMAVNAHGHQRTTEDIDVLVTPEGLARFKAAAIGLGWLEKFPGSRGVRDTANRVPIDFLLSGGIPGDGKPRGVVFPDPVDVAMEVAGVKFLKLAKLVELKLASGMSAPDRPRDFDDVIRLVRQNRLGEHFADQLHPYVQAKFRELWGYAQRPSDLPE
ncbi:MAG: hypothetical protein JNK15_07060 [Planctomycetes bacterium]|nr:hypothetical protein [Planctomycetota bacterium]